MHTWLQRENLSSSSSFWSKKKKKTICDQCFNRIFLYSVRRERKQVEKPLHWSAMNELRISECMRDDTQGYAVKKKQSIKLKTRATSTKWCLMFHSFQFHLICFDLLWFESCFSFFLLVFFSFLSVLSRRIFFVEYFKLQMNLERNQSKRSLADDGSLR